MLGERECLQIHCGLDPFKLGERECLQIHCGLDPFKYLLGKDVLWDLLARLVGSDYVKTGMIHGMLLYSHYTNHYWLVTTTD